MVSLPKEWVDKNGLEKNSEVDVETGINSVSISAGSGSIWKKLHVYCCSILLYDLHTH